MELASLSLIAVSVAGYQLCRYCLAVSVTVARLCPDPEECERILDLHPAYRRARIGSYGAFLAGALLIGIIAGHP